MPLPVIDRQLRQQRPALLARAGIALAGLALTLAAAALAWQDGGNSSGSWLEALDHAFLDRFLAATAPTGPAPGVAVVDIDDASLAEVGQWPWPRYRSAALVRRVAEGAPQAIGLDILFSEPDRTSLATVQQAFERDFGIHLDISGAPAAMRDNDAYLAATLAAAPAVGARYFYFEPEPGPAAAGGQQALRQSGGVLGNGEVASPRRAAANGQAMIASRGLAGSDSDSDARMPVITGRREAITAPRAHGLLDNIAPIADALGSAGFINMRADSDGLLRRLPLFIELDGRLHPQLAVASQLRALGLLRLELQSGAPQGRNPTDLATRLARAVGMFDGTRLRLGDVDLPVDDSGQLLLRFRREASAYTRVSAVDLLAGRVNARMFKDRVVFIGSSAAGLEDRHNTAVSEQLPGLLVLAAVGDMLQTGQVARLAPRHSMAPAMACLLAGGLLSLSFALLGSPLVVLAAGLAVAAATVAASGAVLAATSVFVTPVMPLLLCALLCTLFCATHYATLRRMGRRWLQQLDNTRLVTIESMAVMAETRHPETGAHIKRTQHYVKAIAEQLQRQGLFGDVLDDTYIAQLYASAPLHDIGKVGMPDHILLKPGRLTPQELVQMRRHAACGRDIIHNLARSIDGDNYLRIAGEIAATHHENWDGSGYPLGLAGEQIPLSGRIMAVADVYDALISERCYKRAFSHGVAMSVMQVERGISFDPQVFDAFRAIEVQIVDIASTWRDDQEPMDADH